MKKLLLALICIVFTFCACEKIDLEPTDASTEESTEVITSTKTEMPYVPGMYMYNENPELVVLNPGETYDLDGDSGYKRTYRLAYYRIDIEVIKLAGDDGFDYLEQLTQENYGNETPEMRIVLLVKHFNIPKEDFIVAVLEDEKISRELGKDFMQEEAELPNPDIIYTFDNEIINAYYRRENPVTPDWDKVVVYESYGDYLAARP